MHDADGESPKEVTEGPGSLGEEVRHEVEEEVEIAKAVKMTFILIPPGKFHMGSPDTEEGDRTEPLHVVRLTEPFYIGK